MTRADETSSIGEEPRGAGVPETISELERLVEIAKVDSKRIETLHGAGQASQEARLESRIALAEAHFRLADAKDDREGLKQSLKEIYQLTQRLIESAQTGYRAGTVGRDQVLAAEKALLEVRLRMKRHGIDPSR